MEYLLIVDLEKIYIIHLLVYQIKINFINLLLTIN